MIIATFASAIATIVIAFYALKTHELNIQMKGLDAQRAKQDQEHRQELRDLYEGIILATLLSGGCSEGVLKEAKAACKSQYTGKTPIFDKLRKE